MLRPYPTEDQRVADEHALQLETSVMRTQMCDKADAHSEIAQQQEEELQIISGLDQAIHPSLTSNVHMHLMPWVQATPTSEILISSSEVYQSQQLVQQVFVQTLPVNPNASLQPLYGLSAASSYTFDGNNSPQL